MWWPLDDTHYIAGRISGTVLRTADGTPFIARDLGRDGEGKFVVVGGGLKGQDRIVVPLEEVNPSSPSLGFTNYDGKAFYLGRWPKRRDWKQGLRSTNMFVVSPLNRLRDYLFGNYVPLIVPLSNKYPSYLECLERVEDIYDSSAFSKNFSLDKNRKLFYKNRQVVGTAEDERPVLHEDYFWLTETLEEELQ